MKTELLTLKKASKRRTKTCGKKSPRDCRLAGLRVSGEIGRCGEDFTAALLAGEVVSEEVHNEVGMDVSVPSQRLGVEVKMSNYTHNQRITVGQITRLFDAVKTPGFTMEVKRGVYALVFYKGMHTTRGKPRKSMIMSRRIDKVSRRTIVARELQYVYLVDIDLMMHLASHVANADIQTLRSQHALCDPAKPYLQDRIELDLSRTYLRKFLGGQKMHPKHRKILDEVYGLDKWGVQEKLVAMTFTKSRGRRFTKSIPVRMIGPLKTIRVLKHLVTRKQELRMRLN